MIPKRIEMFNDLLFFYLKITNWIIFYSHTNYRNITHVFSLNILILWVVCNLLKIILFNHPNNYLGNLMRVMLQKNLIQNNQLAENHF